MGAKLKTTSFVAACLLLQYSLLAQDKTENYLKETIPASLTQDADAVCRLQEIEVEVISPAKITERERSIYTVLNENANHLANYVTRYDKLTELNYVNGTLYNAFGKEIKHFKKKDMSDYSSEGGIAFVSDVRYKTEGFSYNSFPYTVEFEEEDNIASGLYIPSWIPNRTDKMSLEVSRYILTVPANYQFRYKLFNTDIKPTVSQKKDRITYTWEIRNLPVRPAEPFSVSKKKTDPFMLVGPGDFQLQGYPGNMSTWENYGKFYASLQKGRDILPDDVKHTVHQLTDHLSSPQEKISVLYEYLQKNTHYVLIAFGIDGFQTHEASYVAKNKYGDCKALSNFMVALLKEAGIKGYPVLITGDWHETDYFKDFPSPQFNHEICCVPLQNDTVWLECTSQFLPAGYLSGFTSNRYALLIDENRGGIIVHTPEYGLKENISIRNIRAKMDNEGNLDLKSDAIYQALSYDSIEELYHNNSKEKQLEYLKASINLPTYSIKNLEFTEVKSGKLPAMKMSLDLSVNGYAHVTGKRIFINPNILRRSEIRLNDNQERQFDFEFKKERSEVDSIEILIPTGYEIEAHPKDIVIDTPFGRFAAKSIIQSGKIEYYRRFDQYRGNFPISAQNDIRGFYNSIYDSDHSQIVLVKKL